MSINLHVRCHRRSFKRNETKQLFDLALTERKRVSATLAVSYVIKGVLNRAFPYIIVIISAVLLILLMFVLYGRTIPFNSVVEYLSAIAQISATVLSVFYAAFLFLLEISNKRKQILEVVSRADFISSFILFIYAITHSLFVILLLENEAPLSLTSLFVYYLLFSPMIIMVGAIISLGLIVWKIYIHRIENSQE